MRACLPQQELQHHRRRELRRPAEAAAGLVVVPPQRGRGLVQHRGVQRRRGDPARPGQRLDHPLPGAGHLLPAVPPGLPDRGQQPVELRPREVGPAEERRPVRGEEAGHRPAAGAGHALGGLHVDRVDVRPLLPVDLDVDEAGVHQLRGRRRPRTTRAPSRGTSGRPRTRPRAAPARPAAAPPRTPPPTTATSRPGCPCAAAGTGWSRAASRLAMPPIVPATGLGMLYGCPPTCR